MVGNDPMSLNLANAKALRAEIDRHKPVVSTPFDQLCHVVLRFAAMVLDQHIGELQQEARKPVDRGS